MKKIGLIICIAVSFFVQSCNSGNNNVVEYVNDDVVEVKDVELHKLNLDVKPLVPTALCFVDSFLVVCENGNKLKTNFISVYSGNTLLKKFGQLGRGPVDMIAPMYLSDGKCEKRYFTVASASSIMKFDVEYLVSNDSLICITENLPEEVSLCNGMLYDSDTLSIMNCTGDNQITFFDKRTNESKGYSSFDNEFLSNGSVTNFIYNIQVFPAVSGCNNGNILIAYTMQKSLDVVSFDGNLKKRIRFNNYDSNKSKIRLDAGNGSLVNVFYDEDATYYFSSSCVTNDAFYALCQEEYKSSTSRTILYKFDWNGNLLMKYRFNTVFMRAVINNGTIYSIAKSDEGEYEVVYAEL